MATVGGRADWHGMGGSWTVVEGDCKLSRDEGDDNINCMDNVYNEWVVWMGWMAGM